MKKKRNRENYSRSGCGRSSFALYFLRWTCSEFRLAKPHFRNLGLKENPVTPDLMPSDILGSEILDENRQFKFIKGPVFSKLFCR
jgi:hypothetical protein